MKLNGLKQEKAYLRYSAIGNLVLGLLGIGCAIASGSQAILLDGLFNAAYFCTGLFTIKVVALVARGDDQRFPHGYAFFEPLVNGIKGTLVLGVSLAALIGAVQALFSGGREINVGVAAVYALVATAGCALLAWITHRGSQSTRSPLVKADAENWFVNGAVSSSVMLAFIGILGLKALGIEWPVPYVDPIVVLVVVGITIFVPVRMSRDALLTLLNRAPEHSIVQQITELVDQTLASLPVQERFIRVVQPGRQRMVLIHVVLPKGYEPSQGLGSLDVIRQKTQDALSEKHVATLVDIIFTCDRRWGAPLSDGGSIGLRED